jgi:hypothetical protein
VASELRGLRYLQVTWNEWRAAAKLGRGLAATGHHLPQTDLVLAAVALSHDLEVYSSDPHFDCSIVNGLAPVTPASGSGKQALCGDCNRVCFMAAGWQDLRPRQRTRPDKWSRIASVTCSKCESSATGARETKVSLTICRFVHIMSTRYGHRLHVLRSRYDGNGGNTAAAGPRCV